MLSPTDDQFLGGIYGNLSDEAIAPDSPFYVELWEDSQFDPARRLRKHIVWKSVQSLQLFSGFGGSGKTTQLLRLKKELEAAGYLVIYANAESYLSLGEPVEISDFLSTVAGAFSDGLDKDLLNDTFWDRLVHFLTRTEVKVEGVTVKYDAAELKVGLKSSPTLRQRLRRASENRLQELTGEVHRFVEDTVKKVQEDDAGRRVVFLFDSFEKLSGTPSNEQEVMESVQRMFRNHVDLLRLPWVHCVYSVPAWLPFIFREEETVVLPAIKQWHKRKPDETEETPHEAGRDLVRMIVGKRFKPDNLARVFGAADENGRYPLAEKLIEASGGVLRDLFRLLREVLLNAKALPLMEMDIDTAIATVRNEFRMTVEDAKWLDRIHEDQAADPPSTNACDLNRWMRLFSMHFALYFRNDENWYDTHPLVRDEVKRILAMNASKE